MDPALAASLVHLGTVTFPGNAASAIGASLLYESVVTMELLHDVWSSKGFRTSQDMGPGGGMVVLTSGALGEARATKITAFASFICFALATVLLTARCASAVWSFDALHGIVSEDGNLKAAAGHMNIKIFESSVMLEWSDNILLTISDILVIWRASVLFPSHLWIARILIICLWVVNFGIGVAGDALISNLTKSMLRSTGGFPLAAKLNDASNYLSLGINILATGLIGWRLWKHSNTLVKGSQKTQAIAYKTLALLVETGAVFCICQIVGFVLQQVASASSDPSKIFRLAIVSNTFSCILEAFAGIYPSLVTVLVHFQKSIVESIELDSFQASP